MKMLESSKKLDRRRFTAGLAASTALIAGAAPLVLQSSLADAAALPAFENLTSEPEYYVFSSDPRAGQNGFGVIPG